MELFGATIALSWRVTQFKTYKFKCKGIKTMAIEKKSLISNGSKAHSTKSNVKSTPSPKLRTAAALQTASAATHAVTAVRLGKASVGLITAVKLGN